MTARARILVVEDNEIVSETLGILLGVHDYDVICAADVGKALAAIAAHPVDVVLLDYCLGDRTGRPVAERAERAGVPIVWMTGDPSALDTLAAQRHALLAKPFHTHELLAALADAMLKAAPREVASQ